MKLLYFISFRYFISKKQNKYSTFTTFLAIIGISLGLITLIVSSNVMEGFKYKIKEDILLSSTGSINSDILIPYNEGIDSQNLIIKYNKLNNVDEVGIINKYYHYSFIENENGEVNRYGLKILPQKELIEKFKIDEKDKDKLIVPNEDFFNANSEFLLLNIFSNADFKPKFQEIFEYVKNKENKNNIYISEETLNYFGIEHEKYIYIKLDKKYNFNSKEWLEKNINKSEIEILNIKSWDESHSELFQAIQFEALVLKIITFMIIITSSFNIISTIIMIIHEKKNDISLLKTYGMRQIDIVFIFLNIGILIGISSLIVGNFVGYLIANNINEIIIFIENQLNIKIVPESFRIDNNDQVILNYFNFYKSIYFSVIILIIVLLASLIPAISSQKIDPSEALKDE